MPRFAANLTTLFTEVDFLDRFACAAQAGFDAVEFQFPYAFAPYDIARRLRMNGLTAVLFNLPPGAWETGARGLACAPDAFDAVMAGVETAVPYIEATGVRRVHLMAGLGDRRDGAAREAYRRAVTAVAARLAPEGVDVLIEPINPRDMPGYFLDDFAFAADLVRELQAPNLKILFDIYHRQILHGDVTTALRDLAPLIGHVQVASVPARQEPCSGELDDRFLFEELDRLSYAGWVGCEYRPAAGSQGGSQAGLGWFAPYARLRTAAR